MAWTRGELLGEGAYGRVYAGLNQKTGELMAVKVLDLMDRRGNHMHMHLAELQQVSRAAEDEQELRGYGWKARAYPYGDEESDQGRCATIIHLMRSHCLLHT